MPFGVVVLVESAQRKGFAVESAVMKAPAKDRDQRYATALPRISVMIPCVWTGPHSGRNIAAMSPNAYTPEWRSPPCANRLCCIS